MTDEREPVSGTFCVDDLETRRVLLVSNRLPVTVRSEHGALQVMSSVGGLATALSGVHADGASLWIGWPGDVTRLSAEDRAAVDARLSELRCVPVHLTPAEIAHYYDGFSNGVLWPLLHLRVDKVNLDAERDWAVYEAVNRKFAERVAAVWEPGDLVWVHDYQLALVPAMLRAMLPDATVGFFLHVPFPAAEVFTILPWRAEIVRGMMGADLVGFHTASYRRNFADTAVEVLGDPAHATRAAATAGVPRVAVHPIGIDAQHFDVLARSEEVEREVARLREGARGRKIVLGVDRLDYSKGIPRRLLAIERFLTRNPTMRDRVLFIQLAVPTREKVDAYANLRRDVNELVGRINSQFGNPTSSPVQLLYRSIPPAQLIALYRAADAMLVTPLRDGMNLVAKEYVASRLDERGVLVLSEFAGAADQLGEALLVNPHDLGAMSVAIHQALSMPLGEQTRRMRALREGVFSDSVTAWVEAFLTDLDAARPFAGRASLPDDAGLRPIGLGPRSTWPVDAD